MFFPTSSLAAKAQRTGVLPSELSDTFLLELVTPDLLELSTEQFGELGRRNWTAK